MHTKWISSALAATVGLMAITGIAGCGGAGGTAVVGSRSYLGTQAPGDVWNWNITGGTFTATNETLGFTYSGTEALLPATGFMKLTITSTTDPSVAVGSAAYAVELPSTALLIKPAGVGDTKPPIIACGLGANPPGPTVAFNYVTIPKLGWPATDPAYGVASFNVTGNNYIGALTRNEINGTPLAPNPASFTCVDGLMTVAGGDTKAAMTPSGVFVLDFGANNGGAIGVKQPAADVNLVDLASRSYRGFLVSQGKTQCIAATSNGDGTLHGQGYANPSGVETGTSDNGAGVTVTFVSQPNHGQVLIHLDTSGGSESLVASINQVNGKYMLFGFGLGQDGLGYNFILAEN